MASQEGSENNLNNILEIYDNSQGYNSSYTYGSLWVDTLWKHKLASDCPHLSPREKRSVVFNIALMSQWIRALNVLNAQYMIKILPAVVVVEIYNLNRLITVRYNEQKDLAYWKYSTMIVKNIIVNVT